MQAQARRAVSKAVAASIIGCDVTAGDQSFLTGTP
jgi:hypothetical protein